MLDQIHTYTIHTRRFLFHAYQANDFILSDGIHVLNQQVQSRARQAKDFDYMPVLLYHIFFLHGVQYQA